MLDKTIPYYNVIMRYDGPPIMKPPDIPSTFFISEYRSNDVLRWAQMEVDNNDFDTYENAVTYFSKKYLSEPEKIKDRFIGVINQEGNLVGSVICWDDDRNGQMVSSVHWLITDPKIQGRGVGTFLVSMLIHKFSKMNLLPIYLHTQPWSFSAIGIYSALGFRLLKTDSFRGYENQTEKALPILEKHLSQAQYNKLITELL